ncbi:hypothetical protein BY458DRAFT_429451, partial [Sporodiniella umbellata]
YRLDCYDRVSNTKVNIEKTEAVGLSGTLSELWQQLLFEHSIVSQYDRLPLQFLRYLNFPVISLMSQTLLREKNGPKYIVSR